ncbi:MAG: ADP-ribose-binding protein [Desulfuromonas sp.]|nr:MAG: ADP-ribose-binding protein [Desulfuromonas sp.]
MIELSGDLWDQYAAGAVIAITTNGTVDRDGNAIMLRGCARQARDRFPRLPQILGSLIRQHGSHVFDLGQRIVSFPIEEDPFQLPELSLIERSCRELVELADYKEWPSVVVPRPGCGGGGLSWKSVAPILQRHFDERFQVITNM